MVRKNLQKESSHSRIQDPGFGEKIAGKTGRLINKDGSFNVTRRGGERGLRIVYQHLISLSNTSFFLMMLMGYIAVSFLFAIIYFAIGVDHLIGVRGDTPLSSFMDCFYFSTQTFTTVGYGAIAPRGILASTMASFEAFTGLIFFAISTGLMFVRFSRPKALLKYSKNAVIAPFEDGKALMFRLANARNNVLMEASARVMAVMRVAKNDTQNRRYFGLKVEIEHVTFLPLSWTLVHKIDEQSPIFGLSLSDLSDLDFEVLILISAFDDTFHQTVHSRHSYTVDEIVPDAKFVRAFNADPEGKVVMNLNDLDVYEMVSTDV
jgi:inward rectifier potassium channel